MFNGVYIANPRVSPIQDMDVEYYCVHLLEEYFTKQYLLYALDIISIINNLMEKELDEILLYIYRVTGEDISKYEDTFLLKSIEKRFTATGVNSLREYLLFLGSNRGECFSLQSVLTINYSDFFRNPITFAYLEQFVLPALFEKKHKLRQKEVRIWSAACASGQEAYSIALLCEELITKSNFQIKFRVFATDINLLQIETAIKGVYPTSMVGNISLKRLNSNFNVQNDNYTISKQLKNRVIFSQFDLLSNDVYCPPSSIFGDFDIVLCSNLLFYYKPQYRCSILDKISKCMREGSYLVTGETERACISGFGFTEVFLNSAIYQMIK